MDTLDSDLLVGSNGDGPYRIEAALGEGSVGAVYRALDLTTGQRVALKQWHANMLNEEVRARFLREATALTALDHPNIVKVVGHGFAEGVPYVALEYLEGQTVESMLTGGKPLAPALAFELARQALSGIAYAHALQVVHRDLKPENIFVTRDASDASAPPQIKILDYGLAKFMSPTSELGSGSTPLTATGMMIGTPLYMPPEQAAGSSVDLAVDVYSMGCVLFEMLSGRPPYLFDSNLELMNAHLRAPIPQLADALSGMRIAPELQALLDRALAKKQTERFPNAGAMLQALNVLPPNPIAPLVPLDEPQRSNAQAEEQPSAGLAFSWVVALGLLTCAAFVLARAC